MTTSPDTLVDIRGVHKRYGTNPVLRGIDLTVKEHEVVCLIGASGCGKSTLLRCINGLENVSAGEIVIGGDKVTSPGADLNTIRSEVGIVFQSYNLFPHMTVLKNLTLAPRKILGEKTRAAEDHARTLLARIGLQDKADAYPDRLSGGQQQRVAIVRALAMRPRVLLLDEITSALDPELVGEVLSIVRQLADEDMTMILATHEMAFARQVADTVCYVHDGRIHESGPPEQVLADPQDQRTRAFLHRTLPAGEPGADQ